MAFTLETKLGTLLDHPQAKPIVDRYLPGVSTNPMVGMVKGLTLAKALTLPQAVALGITKARAEAMLAEVNKVVG